MKQKIADESINYSSESDNNTVYDNLEIISTNIDKTGAKQRNILPLVNIFKLIKINGFNYYLCILKISFFQNNKLYNFLEVLKFVFKLLLYVKTSLLLKMCITHTLKKLWNNRKWLY